MRKDLSGYDTLSNCEVGAALECRLVLHSIAGCQQEVHQRRLLGAHT